MEEDIDWSQPHEFKIHYCPDRISVFVDGNLVEEMTGNIPSIVPMRLCLQPIDQGWPIND